MSVNRLLLFLLLLYVPEVLRPNYDQISTLKFYETPSSFPIFLDLVRSGSIWLSLVYLEREEDTDRGGEPDPLKKRLLFV